MCQQHGVACHVMQSSPEFLQRFKQLNQELQMVFAAIESAPNDGCFDESDYDWLCENLGSIALRAGFAGASQGGVALAARTYAAPARLRPGSW